MKDLSSRIKAIELAAGIGMKIISEKPEMADKIADYYEKKFAGETAEYFDIASIYSINKQIARSVVSFIVKGYKGSKNIPAYEGIIKDKSRIEKIGKEHQKRRGKEAAEYNKKHNNTIFGLTPEQQAEHNKSKGYYSGKKAFLNKSGFHSEKYKNKRRKFGIMGSLTQGKAPWVLTKKETEHGKMNETNYAYHSSKKLKKSIKDIVDDINMVFHKGKQIRNYNSIANMIVKTKKEKDSDSVKEIVPWSDEERIFVYEFIKIEHKYPNNRITDYKISEIINNKFHNGKGVRTKNSIYRQRKNFEAKYNDPESILLLEREIEKVYEKQSNKNYYNSFKYPISNSLLL